MSTDNVSDITVIRSNDRANRDNTGDQKLWSRMQDIHEREGDPNYRQRNAGKRGQN